MGFAPFTPLTWLVAVSTVVDILRTSGKEPRGVNAAGMSDKSDQWTRPSRVLT